MALRSTGTHFVGYRPFWSSRQEVLAQKNVILRNFGFIANLYEDSLILQLACPRSRNYACSSRHEQCPNHEIFPQWPRTQEGQRW